MLGLSCLKVGVSRILGYICNRNEIHCQFEEGRRPGLVPAIILHITKYATMTKLFFLFTVLFWDFGYGADAYTYTPCLEQDSLELVKIYTNTGGDNWTNSWNLNDPVATWYGVTLTADGCSVAVLEMDDENAAAATGNNLQGSFPNVYFPELIYLGLAGNSLTSLGNIQAPKLERLVASYNELENVPSFQLPNINTIDLSGNKISVLPEFQSNTLEVLLVGENFLTDLPSLQDFQLPNLRRLDLNNNLFFEFPDLVCTELISFSLARNKLTQVPNFSGLPKLRTLDLGWNLFTNAPDFQYLDSLRSLTLRHNQITSVPDFSNLPYLEALNLRGNELTNIPNFKLQNLAFLDLAENNLVAVPDFRLPKLEILDLNKNELHHIPNFRLPNLEFLYLHENYLEELPPLEYLTSLDRMVLAFNRFSLGDLFSKMTWFPNLNEFVSQDEIGVTLENSSTLSVIAGGLTANNTYQWYKDGVLQSTQIGDSTFTISGSGRYRCLVTCAFLTGLELYSREFEVCSSSLVEWQLSANYSTPSCPSAPLEFEVTPASNRHAFFRNGSLVQDGSTNTFIADYLKNGDIITAMVYDVNGCVSATNRIVVDAYGNAEMIACDFSMDSLRVSLIQGTPPWQFDLIRIDEHGFPTTEIITVANNLSTTFYKENNIRYEIENLQTSDNTCLNPNAVRSGYIEGPKNVCVGYSNPQKAYYSASFGNTAYPGTLSWNIYPQDAVVKDDVAVLGGYNDWILELDFSNPHPGYDEITLEVQALTDFGVEFLRYTIKLDKKCVWPGDANADGDYDNASGFSWVNDMVANSLAYRRAQAEQNITLPSRRIPDGYLAQSVTDWLPQSAKDWSLELSDGTIVPYVFETRDSLGNVLDTLNMKYADCNGDGIISVEQNWVTMASLFENVSNPSDVDIITYHDHQANQHNGNAPTFAQKSNYGTYLRVENPAIIYPNNTELVFSVTLGDSTNVIEGVEQVIFVGNGNLGAYGIPEVKLTNSHLTNDNSNTVDYPFGNGNMGIKWYTSIARTSNDASGGATFRGEEVCQLICHITIIPLLEDTSIAALQKGMEADSIPITFHIPAAAIVKTDGSVIYTQSNVQTLYISRTPVLRAKAFLQGAFEENTLLMHDNLRNGGFIPAQNPYSGLFGNGSFPTGGQDVQLTDSTKVLSVTGPDAVVDWILIELRSSLDSSLLVSSQPALLRRNGKIVDVDGVSEVSLKNVVSGNYYVVIRHRNHLPIMTKTPVRLDSNSGVLDFTIEDSFTLTSTGQVEVLPGVWAMCSGDVDQSYDVSGFDGSIWKVENGYSNVYLSSDLNMDGQVEGSDKIIWSFVNGLFSNVPR